MHASRPMHIAAIAVVAFFSVHAAAGSPSSRPSRAPHPLVGTYSCEEAKLVLAAGRAANVYTGTLALGGQVFPCTASGAGAVLAGTYSAGMSRFDFSLVIADDGTTRLMTDRGSYSVVRRPSASDASKKGDGGPRDTRIVNSTQPADEPSNH